MLVICCLTGCKSSERKTKNKYYSLHDSFLDLEGVNTKYWKKDITLKDQQLLDLLEPIYYKFNELQFSNQDAYKIPKVMHFIWLGPRNFPATSVQHVRSWIAHHPDWKVIFWTDRKRQIPCKKMEVRYVDDFSWTKLKHYYDGTLNWAERSDYLRYEILAKEGGFYIDHDVECAATIDDLAKNYDFIVGLELPHHLVQGYTITPSNAFIGAIPNHGIIQEVFSEIENVWNHHPMAFTRDRIEQYDLVMQRSYMPLTYAILSKIQSAPGINIAFPAFYFYSKDSMPGGYAIHLFATTWAFNNKEKVMNKDMYTLKYANIKCGVFFQKFKLLLIVIAVLFLIQLLLISKKRNRI